MRDRPRLLDLYCGAGGASKGYAEAGFEVVGVDIHPQPRYPYPFIQVDALTLNARFLRFFDFVHAGPPCQFGTVLRHAPNANNPTPRKAHINLIPQTRALLQEAGVPYCIENVEGVREHLIDPVTLCGTMFGLGAQGCELQRHRLFEIFDPGMRTNMGPFFHTGINASLGKLQCSHVKAAIGIYGGHARRRSAAAGGRGTRDVWEGGHKAAASEAMNISWMTLSELSEAIPPDYTLAIGTRIREYL